MNKEPQFYELTLTVRAGTRNAIDDLAQLAIKDYLTNPDKKINSWSSNSSNFTWHLSNEMERKGE